jgi:hypothetical protein
LCFVSPHYFAAIEVLDLGHRPLGGGKSLFMEAHQCEGLVVCLGNLGYLLSTFYTADGALLGR